MFVEVGPGAAVVGDAVAAGVGNDEGLLLTSVEFALGGGYPLFARHIVNGFYGSLFTENYAKKLSNFDYKDSAILRHKSCYL